MSVTRRFVGPGIALFIDQLIVAASNWIYWLIVSRFILVSELGQATTVYSLTILISTSAQLGLEYGILKRSSAEPSKLLGTVVSIELVIALAMTPLLIYSITNLYSESIRNFTWLAVGIFIPSFLSFATRFVLLGISDVRTVLLVDTIGTIAKFGTVFILLYDGEIEAYGILLSILVQGIGVTAASLYFLLRMFGISISRDLGYIKGLLKEGLSNLPFKLSKVFIMSLSVVLLGVFGVSDSDIGIFYISLMITIVVTSLPASIAFMVVPVSAEEKDDLSTGSVRIGISLTAPLVTALVTAPGFLLSLLGTQYVPGELVLLVLSYGTLPFSVALNAISSFNNRGNLKRIAYIGAIEIISFLVVFWLLVPYYGTLGAALSMLVAFIISCIPSLAWSGRIFTKYVATSTISILVGSAVGYLLGLILGAHMQVLHILGSVTVTIITIIVLKNTTPGEIRSAFNTLVRIKH